MKLFLITSLSKSLNWLNKNKTEFSQNNGDSDLDKLLLLKPISELVLTLKVLNNLGNNVNELSNWAWNEIEQGNYLVDILTVRPDLVDLVSLYSSFYDLNYRNKKLEKLLHVLASLDSSTASEKVTWCKIALQYNFEKLGICLFQEDLFQESWLIQHPEPWIISDEIAYSITHEIFYLTDFGMKKLDINEKTKKYLEIWLPVWIKSFIYEENWDLVGELLLTAYCINSEKLHWTKEFLSLFLNSQNKDGSFPGPTIAGRSLMNNCIAENRKYFLSNYHTTLVGIMLMSSFQSSIL